VERLREIYDGYVRLVERLEGRGVRLPRRPLIVAGFAAAATSVVLATVLWASGRSGASEPPIAFEPVAALKDGGSVVNAATAQVLSIAMVSESRWAAGWSDCSEDRPCRYAAVVDRDGVKATAPEWPVPYATLRAGGEAIAVAPPKEGTLTGGMTVLFRLTYQGPVTAKVRYLLPTRTFASDEILSDRIVPGRIVVVNVKESTVRMLEGPATRSPFCDTAGRCWALAGVARTDLVWTDDGGRTWGSALLDDANQRGKLAVSPDGKTLVSTSVTIGARSETVAKMRLSTDGGVHWTTVREPPWDLSAPPVAFDDGTALALGAQRGHPTPRVYRIDEGAAKPQPGSPGEFIDLTGDANLLYGPKLDHGKLTSVGLTTDTGNTWTDFSPR